MFRARTADAKDAKKHRISNANMQISPHSTSIGASKRDARAHWQIRACKSSRQSEISEQWDKNGLTYVRNYVILRMEPPKERFRRAHNPKVGSTPNIAAPLLQIAPNNLQTPLNKTLIALGGSIQKIFMRSPPRAEYAHCNSNVHGSKIL